MVKVDESSTPNSYKTFFFMNLIATITSVETQCVVPKIFGRSIYVLFVV